MARYKEIWAAPDDDSVVGILDTETGASIPLAPGNGDYRAYLDWVDAGNTADPGYTETQIDAAAVAAQAVVANKVAAGLGQQINQYRDAVAAGRTPPINKYKYQVLLKKRAFALKHNYI